jgi:hypothetical protein
MLHKKIVKQNATIDEKNTEIVNHFHEKRYLNFENSER